MCACSPYLVYLPDDNNFYDLNLHLYQTDTMNIFIGQKFVSSHKNNVARVLPVFFAKNNSRNSFKADRQDWFLGQSEMLFKCVEKRSDFFPIFLIFLHNDKHLPESYFLLFETIGWLFALQTTPPIETKFVFLANICAK